MVADDGGIKKEETGCFRHDEYIEEEVATVEVATEGNKKLLLLLLVVVITGK